MKKKIVLTKKCIEWRMHYKNPILRSDYFIKIENQNKQPKKPSKNPTNKKNNDKDSLLKLLLERTLSLWWSD